MHNELLDVIEYKGSNDVLVHRSEIENFNSKSQLIVDESQEAIFYKDGQALDLFGAGRHSLTTENIPLIRRLVGKLFDNKTPFPCAVYFINKVCNMDVLWGTDTPVSLEDPKYHLLIDVRAHGTMVVQVSDSRKFVVGVAGKMNDFTLDGVKRGIKGAIMMVIKNAISNAIAIEGISILDINAHLERISQIALEKINKEIDYFGLRLVRFYVNSISCTPDDLQELKDAKSKAASMIVEAEAMAKSRAIQGYDYRTERQFDVLEKAASNEGGVAGSMVGTGVGLGVGLGVGGAVGQMASGALNQQNQAQGRVCPNCSQVIPEGAKFCPGCGNKIEAAPAKKFCTNCGTQVEAGAKFCPNCGQKIN